MRLRDGVLISTRHLLAVGGLLIGAATPPASGQVRYEQVSRLRYEERRAESALARLLGERGRVTGASARALEARINLRVLVHLLYSQAAAQTDVRLRCLIGARADIAREGLADMDRLVDLLGSWEDDLAKLPKDTGNANVAKQRQTLQARLQGVSLLADIAGEKMPEKLAGAAEATELTNQLARSVLLMAVPDHVGPKQLSLPGAWPERDHAAKPTGEPPAAAKLDLDQLAARVEASGLSVALRSQMLDFVRRVRVGLQDPKRRAEATALGRLTEIHFETAQTIAQSKLITESAKTALEAQIRTGLLLYSDPRTRPLGLKRLDLASRSARGLAGLAKVPLKDSVRGPLATVMRKALDGLANPLLEDQSMQLLAGLDRLTGLILRLRREYDDVRVAKPFDRPFDETRAACFASIDAALADLANEDLGAVNKRIGTMTRYASDLDLIRLLPEALELMRRVLPSRSVALRQRLVKTSEALAGDDKERGDAVRFLRSVLLAKSLIDRFSELAYDRQLYSDMDKITGGRMKSLRKRGDTLAAALVAGLATSPKKGEGAKAGKGHKLREIKNARASMSQLLSVLSATRALVRLDRLDSEVQRLQRWRAWPLQTESADEMIERLASSVAAASRAVKDEDASLATAVQAVRGYAPLAEILVALGEQYGGRLSKAPEGGLGVISRLYEDLRHSLTPAEQAVLRICYEINEAGYADQMGLPEYAARHLTEARKFLKAALRP